MLGVAALGGCGCAAAGAATAAAAAYGTAQGGISRKTETMHFTCLLLWKGAGNCNGGKGGGS